jgi:hypothetical protein
LVARSTLLIISIGFTMELSPTKGIAMSKGQKGDRHALATAKAINRRQHTAVR